MLPWVSQLIGIAAIAVAGLIARHIKKPSDLDRAHILERIAAGAAALLVSLNPNATWAQLFQQLVEQIAAAAGVPTQNREAIQRVAAKALTDLGLKNDAGK